jgi:S-adenosyl methyltransferase
MSQKRGRALTRVCPAAYRVARGGDQSGSNQAVPPAYSHAFFMDGILVAYARLGELIESMGDREQGPAGRSAVGPYWSPPNLPLDKPSAARMYDYFLGGYHNFAVDRQAADAAIAIYPDFPLVMQANRAFLRRAVKYLISQGVRRFLDLGSGIPTVDNTHHVARRADPDARVVYVDNDPIAVAHSTALLRGEPSVAIIEADAVDYQQLLSNRDIRALLDEGEPVGLLIVFVLHFVLDDQRAYDMVRSMTNALPSGSYVVISHGTDEDVPPEVRDQLLRLYSRTTNPVRVRRRAEFARFFDGLELVEPGITYVPSWRPEAPDDLLVDQPERSIGLAAVARKP